MPGAPHHLNDVKRVAAASVLSLVLVACGTRADFDATPVTVGTQVIEETIGGTAAPSVLPTAGSTTSVTQPGSTTRLKGGATIQEGVIKVGGLFPLSGGLSALGVPPAKAAQAYFRWLNDHGGIDGLKVDFRICDDKADPNQSAACTERLVNDGIVAMGPSFTPFSPNVVPILERKGVPWIGYDGINVEGFSSDIVVTVGAPIQTMGHAILPYWYRDTERRTGQPPRRIGVVYLDVPPARTYLTEAKNVMCPKLGCTIGPEVPVTYTTLNYTSICLRMQNADVDGVWIVTDPASAVKMLVQCREARYRPNPNIPGSGFLGQHGIYLDLTVEQSGSFADGMLANSALLPPSQNVAAVREMKRIVGTYEKNVDYGYFTALGYASARMFADITAAALRIDPTLSRRSLLQGASGIRDYSCRGLCRDVNLAAPAAKHGGNHWVWMVRARYGQNEDDQWIYADGPIDAWRAETWPRPGRP